MGISRAPEASSSAKSCFLRTSFFFGEGGDIDEVVAFVGVGLEVVDGDEEDV